MKQGLSSWLKFNTVGIAGMVVQLLVLAVLKSAVGMNVLVATALAVEAAVLHNFIWHERWTWAHRGLDVSGAIGRLLRFNATNGIISIAGNLALMWVMVSRLRLNYLLSNIAAIVVCSLVNFLVSDRLVFNR